MTSDVIFRSQSNKVLLYYYREKTFQKNVFGFMTFETSGITFCENQTSNKRLQNTIGYPGKNH